MPSSAARENEPMVTRTIQRRIGAVVGDDEVAVGVAMPHGAAAGFYFA